MSTHCKMNNLVDSSVDKMEESLDVLKSETKDLLTSVDANSQQLESIEDRIQRMAMHLRATEAIVQTQEVEVVSETGTLGATPTPQPTLKHLDELSNTDIVMTCIAGGIAVLVDFLVVKTPNTIQIGKNGKAIEGSPATALLRKIGFEKDDKTSGWVTTLEKYFKVSYDKSVIPGAKGFRPETHRLYSLAHDPSPSGMLWAIVDSLRGTTSYIDANGRLTFIATKNVSARKCLAAPLIWIGHIVSDIFSKVGIPIPGACLLRTLQFGSIGEKGRTIEKIVEYMYIEGYDLRHLATMSLCNGCIELILRLYYILTKERIEQFARPAALIQADKAMQKRRLAKMRLGAYAIATVGNTAKLACYGWNPLGLNLPVWLEFLRTSIKEYEYSSSSEKLTLDAVKGREDIEQGFDMLYQKLEDL